MSLINFFAFEKLSSTSTYARENASSLPLPSLITANEQTEGRGRRGNSFFSPKDTGLYMTLLTETPRNCSLLTPAAAVAVCRVLEYYGIKAEIKWVNDIFYGKKKVCGILTERFFADKKDVVAIGIGINITTDSFPDNLSLAGSLNIECNKNILAKQIAEEILSGYTDEFILNEYRKRLMVIGKEVSFSRNGVLFSAQAVDINESCNLIVTYPDGKTEVLSSGEISIKI